MRLQIHALDGWLLFISVYTYKLFAAENSDGLSLCGLH